MWTFAANFYGRVDAAALRGLRKVCPAGAPTFLVAFDLV